MYIIVAALYCTLDIQRISSSVSLYIRYTACPLCLLHHAAASASPASCAAHRPAAEILSHSHSAVRAFFHGQCVS